MILAQQTQVASKAGGRWLLATPLHGATRLAIQRITLLIRLCPKGKVEAHGELVRHGETTLRHESDGLVLGTAPPV